MKRTMMAACILSLVACGGSKDDVASDQQQDWESRAQSLVYSFPDRGQVEVPVPSPIVLRFSSPVVETAPAVELREMGTDALVPVDLEWVDGKRGLILTPQAKLKPLTDYVVNVPRIELEKGLMQPVDPAKPIVFSTRGLHEGPKSLVARDTFEIVRTIPDGVNFAVTDFSSFRLQFSQPLDPSTVKYGDASDSTVQLMGPEGLVDAHLLISGPYITIDPKEDLTPGGDYSLNITGDLTSVYGDSLPGGSLSNPMPYTLAAKPVNTTSPTTGKRVSMVQDIADTGEISPLTGKPINLVPMASVLLGEETATQASGTLAAELAFVPNFPDQTPLRIKRGSLIEGASIAVEIGGEVPAGFESGAVRMDFLSDATGYLLPNPYSNMDDAPRQVRLWMDVAVSTETPAANGAITQDLLHIELVGTSIVEDGQMVINAVGVVEPNVLASERATGLLSFYMKAYEDQDNPPQVVEDIGPLEFQSWTHESTRSLSLGDAIVLNFSKGIDPGSVGEVRLVEQSLDGQKDIEVGVYTRGAALVIQPQENLRRSYQLPAADPVYAQMDQVRYSVQVDQGISGLNGIPASITQSLEFEFDADITEFEWRYLGYRAGMGLREDRDIFDPATFGFDAYARFMNQSVAVLLAYPGFPCAMDTTEQNIAAGIAGRCRGALATPYRSLNGSRDIGADDLLPIPTHPANQPIVVYGSQEFLPESVSLGGSFAVESLNEDGSYQADVTGSLRVEGSKITFTPEEPWEPGTVYRYTLRSNGDDPELIGNVDDIAPATCDGSQAICDLKRRPLKTQFHSVTVDSLDDGGRIVQHSAWAISGGPDMTILFRAGEATENVLQALVAKSLDANANFYHDVSHGPLPSLDEEAIEYAFNYRSYGEEEGHVDFDNRELQPHLYDPQGIQPVPNSVKILTKPWEPIVLATDENGNPLYDENWYPIAESGYAFNALNVGCGYDALEEPIDFMDPVGAYQTPYTAQECPESKFTHLHSALAAEVTGIYEEGKGIQVNIWPSQIIGTSINTAVMMNNMAVNKMDSGVQVMRLRYAKDDPECVETPSNACFRSQPQKGWIVLENGQPVLNAEVDLYVDAVALESQVHLALGDINHNLVSVPLTISLSGPVSFDESGQMVVDQISQNEVRIGFNLEQMSYDPFNPAAPPFLQTVGEFELIIPDGGTHIRYVTEVIK